MAIWPVSDGVNPDEGEPFIIFEDLANGLVSIHLTAPSPKAVTPETAEHVRIRLGAAINASRGRRQQP